MRNEEGEGKEKKGKERKRKEKKGKEKGRNSVELRPMNILSTK